MPSPRVAVIIPCYNDGALAKEAVASVTEREALELIVVDDGSTEAATLAALEELRQQGVCIIRRSNGGLSAARMTGVGATSAPYIYPLDADDLLCPNALCELAGALDACPGRWTESFLL